MKFTLSERFYWWRNKIKKPYIGMQLINDDYGKVDEFGDFNSCYTIIEITGISDVGTYKYKHLYIWGCLNTINDEHRMSMLYLYSLNKRELTPKEFDFITNQETK